MFKYDQFPILRLEVYNNEGVLVSKLFRMKSHQPYYVCSTFSLVNIIDFETSQHLTLKKIFKTKNLSKDSILSELFNQSKMKGNENFIEIKQIYEDHENIYLIMEEKHESLQQILNKRKILFEKQVQYIFCQLVTILQNLRSNNIFHGGICLSHLYLNPKTNKIKLSGFGNSVNVAKIKQYSSQHINLFNSSEPTPYMAPQLLDNTVENAQIYYAGDIWSVGVVIYTLLVGQQPFTNYDRVNNLRTSSIIKLKTYVYEFPQASLSFNRNIGNNMQSISTVWKELLKSIFLPKDERISLRRLMEHPLNLITQSKFIQMSGKFVPSIKNHNISERDEILDEIQFDMKKIKEKEHKFQILSYQRNQNEISQQLLTGGEINTQILRLILAQYKNPVPVPLICQPPSYIERYCFIKHENAVGYILQNSIGIVFGDGSCVMGQNIQQYTYIPNQCPNLDDVLKIYCQIYDEYYNNICMYQEKDSKQKESRSSRQSGSKKQENPKNYNGSYSNFYNLNGGVNISINLNANNSNCNDYINENVSNMGGNNMNSLNTPNAGNGSKLMGGSKNNNNKSNASLKKVNKSRILTSSPINLSSNSPSNTSPSSSANNTRCPSPNTYKNSNQNYLGNSQPLPQSKFAQSYLSWKNSQLLSLYTMNSLPSPKEKIYSYYLQYFGDRVINSEIKLWVIGFWKLNCGFVFLYNDGTWQVNLRHGCDQAAQKFKQKEGKSGIEKKNQGNFDLKRGKEGAVLIDKYGIAWWLRPNRDKTDYMTQNKQFNPKLGFDFTNINANMGKNVNPFVNKNNGNSKQSLNSKNKSNFSYNYLAIKIARRAVATIKNKYIKEFQNIMEPYMFSQLQILM